jgi:hypothetical protein
MIEEKKTEEKEVENKSTKIYTEEFVLNELQLLLTTLKANEDIIYL